MDLSIGSFIARTCAPRSPASSITANISPVPVPDPVPVPVPAPAPVAVPAPKKSSTSTSTSTSTTKKPTVPIDAGTPSVIIGPNVHIGSNVIIGSNPPPAPSPSNTASRPADYDPRHFDPVSYLPTATALAQQLAPDAHLTRFEFDPVYPDGHVDLTAKSARDHEYDFRSPSRSAHPADVPRNVAVDRPCMIHVEVTASGATATLRNNDTCNAKLVHAPRCHLPSIWKQAITSGIASDLVARIAWLSDEQWFFDADLDSSGSQPVKSFPDRCP